MDRRWGLYYDEQFTSLSNWVCRPARHAEWQIRDRKLYGTWLTFHNSLVLERPIAGDTELEVDFGLLPMDWDRAMGVPPDADASTTVEAYRGGLPPEGAANFNILFKTTGPNGEDFLAVFDEWSGKGKMGLEHFRTYFFTLTYQWARMRRCPGYTLLSDRQDVHSTSRQPYEVKISQEGKRTRYWLNGDLIHDVTDAGAHHRGHVGFVLSASRVEVDRFTIRAEQ